MNAIAEPLTAQAQIRDLIDKKIEAVYGRDEVALLAAYAPDIVSFDIGSPLQNKGIEGMTERLQKWFAGYMGHINQEVTDVEIAASGDVAYSHFLMRTYGTSIQGEELDMWYRVTSCYKYSNGCWFITHEHLSEPVDMSNGQAIFDLKP